MGSIEEKQYRKLFIGRLSRTTTNDSLKEFFEQWGDIVDAIVIKDIITKRSRGFGFITYSQLDMADLAMLNRPHIIDGHQVVTKPAVPRKDTDEPGIVPNVKTMIVFGIKEQSENDLLKFFGGFGKINNVSIITDKYTGERKGFGFIDYDKSDSVDKAVLIPCYQVAGGILDVRKSIKRSKSAGGGRSGQDRGDYGGGGNRNYFGGNPLRNDQWKNVGHHNRLNSGCGGYGNSGMGGGYGSDGCGGGYGGRAWQGSGGGEATQSWDNSNHSWGSQGSVDNGWGNFQQPSNNCNNWGANQNYGGCGGGPMRSNYTPKNRSAPYGNPGAGNANSGNAGGFGKNHRQRY